ncbi:MAG TPA: 16S rRNA (adenine(1518)-N(6)/adenine(1519)-N(6))-dimethyltransferase RsmA [Gemmatimonadales bacterium]|nr:16S rRNA (adenine(1518)-N(6)/adenine(1519)-N(6))-dimethyltransferase RsmA [Gemmatimonadales bacterium]
MSRPKKSLSQNFLSDPRILARIADAVDLTPDDTVLEIGPGRGALTRELLARARRVVVIEKDSELAARLAEEVAGRVSRVTVQRSEDSRLTIHEGDALELDWHALAGPDYVIAGNIPYHITSPLIDKALQPPRARRVVFLMQKEVAERIVAPPGGEEYGALTIGVQAVARVEKLFVVPKGAFHPVPKVDSAVVRFTPLARPLIVDREVAAFRRFTVGMFSYRRKQLARGIRELTGFSAEQATRAITHALASMPLEGEEVYPPVARPTFSPDSRPEQVAPLGFVSLYRAVVEAGWQPSADPSGA